uniref:PE-PGRS family protein n=1 Tax=Angiostrongylus cantonensis TaxID=6313 RepID=A0A0K0DIK1_ANGCA
MKITLLPAGVSYSGVFQRQVPLDDFETILSNSFLQYRNRPAVEVKPDEFSGLIGNIAGNFIRDRVGGPGGDILAGLADNVLGGGGGGGGYNRFDGGGGGFYGGGGGGPPQPPPEPKSKGSKALDFLGGLIGGRKDKKGSRGGGYNDGGFGGGGYSDGGFGGGGRGQGGGGGGFNLNDIGGIINSISGGGGGGGGRSGDIGSIIGGIGSLIGGGGGGGQYGGGGGNINPNRLNGGMVNIIGNLIGEAAHRFLGVDPATGRIIGS